MTEEMKISHSRGNHTTRLPDDRDGVKSRVLARLRWGFASGVGFRRVGSNPIRLVASHIARRGPPGENRWVSLDICIRANIRYP